LILTLRLLSVWLFCALRSYSRALKWWYSGLRTLQVNRLGLAIFLSKDQSTALSSSSTDQDNTVHASRFSGSHHRQDSSSKYLGTIIVK
jgi:hypothetical protein